MSFQDLVNSNKREDNYINATKWCEEFDKKIAAYNRLPETRRFNVALERKLSDNKHVECENHTLRIVEGRGKKSVTWLHPLAAIHLAQWLSPDFAVYVAETFKAFLEADVNLITDLIGRAKAEDAEEIASAALVKYLRAYKPLMSELKNRGAIDGQRGTYAQINSKSTKAVLGSYPEQVKEERGITPSKSARSKCTMDEHLQFGVLHSIQTKAVVKADAQGHHELVDTCNKVSTRFQEFINEFS